MERWKLFEKGSLIFIHLLESEIKHMDMFKKLCKAKSETDTSCSPESFVSVTDLLKDKNGKLSMKQID